MVTVSGGRSSAMMARHIQTHEKYKDFEKVYVFCNTGMERPETIEFLQNIEKFWGIPLIKIEGVYSQVMGVGIDCKIVDWDNLDMQAKTFENAIMHLNKGTFEGLPFSEAPYCSGALKKEPAKKLCDNIFGVNNYIKAIGYRLEDMPKRITDAEIKEDKTRIFPLLTDFQYKINKFYLSKFWDEQPFKLGIHSKYGNCELCWKKSDKNLVETIRYGTRFIDWYARMEQQYNNTSFRGRKSIFDYVKIAQLPAQAEFDFEQQLEEDKCVCNF
jgi:hypothetical protein